MAQPKRKESRKTDVTPASRTGEGEGPLTLEEGPWKAPDRLSRRALHVLLGVLVLCNIPVLHMALRCAPEANVTLPYQDDFSSAEKLRDNYFTTGGFWRLIDGALFSPGVRKNPLWLKAKLPNNVSITFDAKATSPEGDIRFELFGDGENHLSGYEVELGGWNNSRSAIVRLRDAQQTFTALEAMARQRATERGLAKSDVVGTGVYTASTPVRVEAPGVRVDLGKVYRIKLERRGGELRVSMDDRVVLDFNDPFPLTGRHHDRFGLSSDEGDITYDNLKVSALDAEPFASLPVNAAPLTPPPGPFADAFDRAQLGDAWRQTDPSSVKLEDGTLVLEGARNHPLWLTHPLPENVSIEFDAWTDSPDGDIKVEVFGDGSSYHTGDPHAAYDATGYVLVLGGWHNTLAVIAREEEHAENRVSRADSPVQPGRHYHWKIERGADHKLAWSLDGKPFLTFEDPEPLTGAGHQFFAFSGWDSKVHFDNLKVTAL